MALVIKSCSPPAYVRCSALGLLAPDPHAAQACSPLTTVPLHHPSFLHSPLRFYSPLKLQLHVTKGLCWCFPTNQISSHAHLNETRYLLKQPEALLFKLSPLLEPWGQDPRLSYPPLHPQCSALMCWMNESRSTSKASKSMISTNYVILLKLFSKTYHKGKYFSKGKVLYHYNTRQFFNNKTSLYSFWVFKKHMLSLRT